MPIYSTFLDLIDRSAEHNGKGLSRDNNFMISLLKNGRCVNTYLGTNRVIEHSTEMYLLGTSQQNLLYICSLSIVTDKKSSPLSRT